MSIISICKDVPKENCLPEGVPKPPKDGVLPVAPAGAVPVEAPPNKDGFAASPAGFPALLPKPKVGVDEAPAVAPPPPKRPPAGLLVAGVLDAPPPKSAEAPEFPPAPPNSPPPGVLDAVFAVPKMDGEELPVVFPAPPNSPPAGLGVLEPEALALGCPNVKPDMVAVDEAGCRERGPGVLLVVAGSYLLESKLVQGVQLAREQCRNKESSTDCNAQSPKSAVKACASAPRRSATGASMSQPPKVGQTAARATRRYHR